MKKVNKYISAKDAKFSLIQKAYDILIQPFDVMGLSYSATEEKSEDDREKLILDAIVKFRDQIRENAKTDFKKILEICDVFRDETMVDLDIRLEDKKIGEPAVWKHESKEVLLRER